MAFPSDLTNAVDNITILVVAHLNNLEAKVGIDGSRVVTSLDYLVKAATDPGHAHTAYAPAPITTTIASSATPTPAMGAVGADVRYHLTALEEAAEFGEPTGTPVDGQNLRYRIKDNGVARALTWNAIYRDGSELVLPTSTTPGETLYVSFLYNDEDSKFDLVGVIGGI